jgi:6-phosphogluconolactonase (cycloisomerase 2 family)
VYTENFIIEFTPSPPALTLKTSIPFTGGSPTWIDLIGLIPGGGHILIGNETGPGYLQVMAIHDITSAKPDFIFVDKDTTTGVANGATYVTTTLSKKSALSCDYQGGIKLHPFREDWHFEKVPNPIVMDFGNVPHGPAKQQEKSHPHMISMNPYANSSNNVYVCDLGTDRYVNYSKSLFNLY